MTETPLRTATAVLASVGIAIAGYLVYERYTGGVISCTTGGCETVQHSSYSNVAGIPVALLGLLTYLALLVLAFAHGEAARAAQLALVLAGVVFSGYLLWAQAVPVGAFCDWCLASDAVMTLTAVVTLLRFR